MGVDAAYFAGFGGVEATARIHRHRAPGGHRPFEAAGETEHGRSGEDLAWWQGIRLNALPSATQGVTHAEEDDQLSRAG